MWDFVLKVTRYAMQTQSYGHLMTDTYPKLGTGSVVAPAAPG